MAINFPNSPQLNETFTVGNSTYLWNGQSWTASATGGFTLPTASTSVLGGVKIDGTTITITDGVISSSGGGGGGEGSSVGLATRENVQAQTIGLLDGQSADITFTGYKSYQLIAVQTSLAAWVTLYIDSTSRTNDSSRLETTDPLPGTGVIAEAITTNSDPIYFAPAIIGYNADSPVSTNIYAKIVNKAGSSSAETITVTLTLLQLEV